jgi:hypothetical protein
MSGRGFLRIVRTGFAPFLKELGFIMETPSLSGRSYRATFTSPEEVVSVSYEPGDEVLFVMVFCRQNGGLSDIDDRSNTPRLSDLNMRYMHTITKEERLENEVIFGAIEPRDNEERLLLKAAKELRLVLPKYLHDARRRGAI